jgi:hypothetical protein
VVSDLTNFVLYTEFLGLYFGNGQKKTVLLISEIGDHPIGDHPDGDHPEKLGGLRFCVFNFAFK